MTCKECTKRQIGCHDTCEEYKEWKKEKKERNDIVVKERSKVNSFYAYNREKFTRLSRAGKYKQRPEKEGK